MTGIRDEIADLLKMSKENREELDTISITYLVESLIEYTKRLERGYTAQEDIHLTVAEFILRFKKVFTAHITAETRKRPKERLRMEAKIIERAITLYDEIYNENKFVTERDLIRTIHRERENSTPEELEQIYL